MRKPRGALPGKLFKLKYGPNSFGKRMFPFFRLHLNQTSENTRLIAIFKAKNKLDKDVRPSVEYLPEETHGIILLGKRTRERQGSIPYVIALIGNDVYKISADCISIVETE